MTGDLPHPNTALQSAILMFGTFLIAYFLRLFRNSRIFGRNVSFLLLNLQRSGFMNFERFTAGPNLMNWRGD